MKTVFFLCALFIIGACTIPTYAQKAQYGPHNEDYGINQQRFGVNYPNGLPAFTYGPPWMLYRQLNAQSDDYIEVRMFIDFDIPFDSVYHTPNHPNPIVEWAELTIEYNETCCPEDCLLRLNVYKLDKKASLSTPLELWNGTEGLTDFNMVDGQEDPVTGKFFITLKDFSGAFKTIAQQGVDQGYLALGFKLQDHPYLEDCARTVNEDHIQLTIKFVGYEQQVKITNTIDAQPDLHLPDGTGNSYSKVRDEQLQTWQNAPYYPIWAELHDHFAETRFWEYTTIPGPDADPEKFHIWDAILNDYLVKKNVPNYDGQQTVFQAVTEEHQNSFIKTKLEFYNEETAEVDFHDPWRVHITGNPQDWDQVQPNNYLTVATEYRPQDHDYSYGVFLNQQVGANYPHYHVRPWKWLEYHPGLGTWTAKNSPTNMQIGDGVFYAETATELDQYTQEITGNAIDVTPLTAATVTQQGAPLPSHWEYNLVYHENNSVVTPKYKMHRSSTMEAQPTVYCSQRKVDIDQNGWYHAVYESGGAIWYIQSEDGGDTWTPEKCITSGIGGQAANPSISVQNNAVFVVYTEQIIVGEGDTRDVVKVVYAIDDVWSRYEPFGVPFIANLSIQYNSCRPAIDAVIWAPTDRNGFLLAIAWDDFDGIFTRYAYVDLVDPDNFSKMAQPVQLDSRVNDWRPQFPSVSFSGEAGTAFMVVWTFIDNNDQEIRADELSVDWWAYDKSMSYVNSFPRSVVNDPLELPVFAASLTRNAQSEYVVAYEVLNPLLFVTQRYFAVRKFDVFTNSWNTTATMSAIHTNYAEPFNPTIGYHETPNTCGEGAPEEGLRVVFNRNWGGGLNVAQIDCGYMEYHRGIPSDGASFSSIVPYAPYGLLLDVFSELPDNLPGYIGWTIASSTEYLPKTTWLDHSLIKEARIMKNGDVALVGVANAKLIHQNGFSEDMEWNAAHDSLIVGIEVPMEAKMRTQDIQVQQGMQLVCDFVQGCTNNAMLAQNVKFNLQVRNAANDQLLASLPYYVYQMPQDTMLWSQPVVSLNQFAGQTVYATIGIDGDTAGVYQAIRNVWVETAQLQKIQHGDDQAPPVPSNITLEQNHPNPFNPSTTINFSLPENAHAKLYICDNLGRTVEVLVNEQLSAGSHSYTFDASGLNSGMYFYRLEADGTVLTKKMQLVK